MDTLNLSGGDLNPTFRLFRSYLDLSDPPQDAPLHVWRPIFAFEAVSTGNYFKRLQRTLPESFRASLTAVPGLERFSVARPGDLENELRSERWEEFCSMLQHFDRLQAIQRATLSNLLNTLGFFSMVTELNSGVAQEWTEDGATGMLAVAVARYVLFLDGVASDYRLDLFKDIAENAPQSALARFTAILHLIVQSARFQKDPEAVEYWSDLGLHWLRSQEHELDAFMYNIYVSRFYRGASFAGFMKGDTARVVEEMNLAEIHAQEAERHIEHDFHKEIIWKENLYPLMESRSKEALWLGDKNLAEKRLRRALEVDPFDSKLLIEMAELLGRRGAYREAAELYLRAARLGPPGREIAWFMAGQCHEALENFEYAAHCYEISLKIDDLGIAPRERLNALATRLKQPSLTLQ